MEGVKKIVARAAFLFVVDNDHSRGGVSPIIIKEGHPIQI